MCYLRGVCCEPTEVIRMSVAEEIRERIETNFAEMNLTAEQVDGLVQFEVKGIAASERVGEGFCRCESTTDQESYYRKPIKGTHGWFHDPLLGGCGGITQVG